MRAWQGDYDGDGRVDLYVGNSNAQSELYRNLGRGAFERKTDTLITQGSRAVRAVTWADIDNGECCEGCVTKMCPDPFAAVRSLWQMAILI